MVRPRATWAGPHLIARLARKAPRVAAAHQVVLEVQVPEAQADLVARPPVDEQLPVVGPAGAHRQQDVADVLGPALGPGLDLYLVPGFSGDERTRTQRRRT
jgi:hypothetical protein